MDNIFDFDNKTRINKDTYLCDTDIYINNDTMYISNRFAEEIAINGLKDNYIWIDHLVRYNYDMCSCRVILKKSDRDIKGNHYRWYVSGRSGDFDLDEERKSHRIDKRVRYKIHKKMLSLYTETKIGGRRFKIKHLMNENS